MGPPAYDKELHKIQKKRLLFRKRTFANYLLRSVHLDVPYGKPNTNATTKVWLNVADHRVDNTYYSQKSHKRNQELEADPLKPFLYW